MKLTHSLTHSLTRTACICLIFFFMAHDVKSQMLFTVEPEVLTQLPEKALKWRKVFKENIHNKEIYLINLKRIKDIQQKGKFNFKIPDDNTVFTAQFNNVKYTDDNNNFWTGNVYGDRDKYEGHLQLTTSNGKVYGEITISKGSYQIMDVSDTESPNGKNLYYLIKKDDVLLNKYKCGVGHEEINAVSAPEHDLSNLKTALQVEQRTVTCMKKVRIMVLYTPQAAAADPNIQTTIDGYIQEFNSIVEQSRTGPKKFEVELAHKQQWWAKNITENSVGTGETFIEIMRTNATVVNLKSQYKADLVVLISNSSSMVAGGNYGHGIAPWKTLGVNGYPSGPNDEHTFFQSSSGYASVHVNTSNRYTFAHEVGHNFGCNHDLFNFPGNGDENHYSTRRFWARGKVLSNINKRTIMAELPIELANMPDRIPYFSNPNKTFISDNGVSQNLGEPKSRQNMIHMDSTAVIYISQYEQGGETESIGISGPGDIYGAGQHTWCPTFSCGFATNYNYSYQWYWSQDGYNYTWLSNTECLIRTASSFGVYGNPATITLKLVVSGYTGVYSDTIPVRIYSNIQPKPMTDNKMDNMLSNIKIALYPNPSDDVIHIELSSDHQMKAKVDILDAFGRVEQNLGSDQTFEAGTHTLSYDIRSLSAGLKFLKVSDGKATTSKAFYILR